MPAVDEEHCRYSVAEPPFMNGEPRTVASGGALQLRRLTPGDVGEAYVTWLNDPEVVRFTETRHVKHTFESVRAYVGSCLAGNQEHLLGIYELDQGRHIGNIKIGPVNPYHLCAGIGLMIGEKTCWGKGYATEAIGLAASYAFGALSLHKLLAGVIAGNEASLRAFQKNGFVVEGTRRKQNCCEGIWCDEIMLGLLMEEWMHG